MQVSPPERDIVAGVRRIVATLEPQATDAFDDADVVLDSDLIEPAMASAAWSDFEAAVIQASRPQLIAALRKTVIFALVRRSGSAPAHEPVALRRGLRGSNTNGVSFSTVTIMGDANFTGGGGDPPLESLLSLDSPRVAAAGSPVSHQKHFSFEVRPRDGGDLSASPSFTAGRDLARVGTLMSSIAETAGVYSVNVSTTDPAIAPLRVVVDEREHPLVLESNWSLRITHRESASLRSCLSSPQAGVAVWSCVLQSRGQSFVGARGRSTIPLAAESVTSDNLSCAAFDEHMEPPEAGLAFFIPRHWACSSSDGTPRLLRILDPHAAFLLPQCVVDVKSMGQVAVFVTGASLQIAAVVDDFGRGSRTLDSSTVLHVARQCAKSLHHLHQLGIVHNEIRTEFIALQQGDADRDIPDCKLLYAGWNSNMAGSAHPFFVAPEVLAGRPATPATDGWSLGVVLYTLLFGRVPFAGATRSAIVAAIQEQPLKFPPEALSGKLRRWRAVLSAMLDRNPVDRLCPGDLLGSAMDSLDSSSPSASREMPSSTSVSAQM